MILEIGSSVPTRSGVGARGFPAVVSNQVRVAFCEKRARIKNALSPRVYPSRGGPPWFNMALSEPSIKILDDLSEGAQLTGRKRELGLEAVYGRGLPPLASASWN
jgi:hypothetical protein